MQAYKSDDVLNARYKLTRLLGEGGMGRVWLAFDLDLERNVAIKEVLPRGSKADTDAFYARIKREARNAANAGDIPSIVTVHDVLSDDAGRPFIVMEYIDGQTLKEYVELNGAFKPDEFVAAALGLVRALMAVHKKGIVHRDIKHGNVLVRANGELVLLDFGIARHGDDTLTASGNISGTPAFMSPEQIRGSRATEAMDVWLLGMTFYFALTGELPFRREDGTASAVAVLYDELPPLPNNHPLCRAVMGMLRKDHARRFGLAKVEEMLALVEPPPRQRAARKPKPARGTSRVRLAVIAAALVVLTAGSWWVYEEFGGGRANNGASPSYSSPPASPSVSASATPTILKAKAFQMVVPNGMTVNGTGDNFLQVVTAEPSENYSLEWLGAKRDTLQQVAVRERDDDVPGKEKPGIDYASGVAFWEYDNNTPCDTAPLASKWCQRGHHMGVVAPAGKGFVVVKHFDITMHGPLNRAYPSREVMIGVVKQLANGVR